MRRKDETAKKPRAAKVETSAEEYSDLLPTREQIRSRAHELYRARCDGGGDGDERTDWVAAERELTAAAKRAETQGEASLAPASKVRR